MKDTHPAIEERFFKMLMEKSGEERLRMGFDMDETARRLVITSLLNQNHDASEQDIKIAVFERFYGSDLSSEIRQKIIEKMRGEGARKNYDSEKPLVEDEAKQLNVQQSPSISPEPEKIKGRFGLRK